MNVSAEVCVKGRKEIPCTKIHLLFTISHPLYDKVLSLSIQSSYKKNNQHET